MITKEIEEDFRKKVCNEIQLIEEGYNRARVATPFKFDDGDHLVILLKKEDNRWILTDEGHTFMHLTYWIDEDDLHKGTRKKIIESALSMYNAIDRKGEIVFKIENKEFGNALYSYIQALLKITDITYLTREIVRSTFLEDFKSFISLEVPEKQREFDYHDPVKDPDAKYVVDCRITNSNTPLFVFAINNDDRCQVATITCMQFELSKVKFNSMAIFENQEEINRKVLARFSDICGKMYSNLSSNRDRVKEYLAPYIHQNG
jgi:hypothetical protein